MNEHLRIQELRGLVTVQIFWSTWSSKSLTEPSTTALVGVYDTQFQAKMRKLWLLKVRRGLDVLKKMERTHKTFYLCVVYTLQTNTSDLIQGHLSSHKQENNNIIKFKLFFIKNAISPQPRRCHMGQSFHLSLDWRKEHQSDGCHNFLMRFKLSPYLSQSSSFYAFVYALCVVFMSVCKKTLDIIALHWCSTQLVIYDIAVNI